MKWAWVVYSWAGFVPVIMWLLISGHANSMCQGDVGCVGCYDRRGKKVALSFSGSAGFTFGWRYFVVAYVMQLGHTQNFNYKVVVIMIATTFFYVWDSMTPTSTEFIAAQSVRVWCEGFVPLCRQARLGFLGIQALRIQGFDMWVIVLVPVW